MKLGDPADKALDAAADGNFGGKHTTNRRAGYSKTVTINGEEITELEWLIRRAKKDATLASGEGRKIVEHYEEQIQRLKNAERERDEARKALRVIADANVSYEAGTADFLDMAHQTVVAVKQLRHRAERVERILAALREPSVGAVDAAWAVYQAQTWWDERDDMSRALRAAIAAAEQEVGCA